MAEIKPGDHVTLRGTVVGGTVVGGITHLDGERLFPVPGGLAYVEVPGSGLRSLPLSMLDPDPRLRPDGLGGQTGA